MKTVTVSYCRVPACERTAIKRGYCNAHYIRWRRKGDAGPAEIAPAGTRHVGCAVEGCERKHRARGLCKTHYSAQINAGAILLPSSTPCSVDQCSRPAVARGYCGPHYLRWRRDGDPGSSKIAKGRNGWRLEVVGYHGAHSRVRAAKGNATGYRCHQCGGAAAEWAYTNDDPAELVDAEGRYSLDVDRYVPMCTPCHYWFDREYNGRQNGEEGRSPCWKCGELYLVDSSPHLFLCAGCDLAEFEAGEAR